MDQMKCSYYSRFHKDRMQEIESPFVLFPYTASELNCKLRIQLARTFIEAVRALMALGYGQGTSKY